MRQTDIEKFARWLQPGAMKDDCDAFKELERGKISIEECIEKFKENNKINKSEYISKKSMRIWLRGLGYLV